MIMSNSIDENWVTSKEILLKTGISRATLNNYIKMGIIPKPVVKRPTDERKRTKKIGYFPEAVFESIRMVKRLKREGNSMEKIARSFKDMPPIDESLQHGHSDQALAKKASASVWERPNGSSRVGDKVLSLTIEDIHSPAYLINQNFEIEWINREAEDHVFNQSISSINELESRNIFKLLFGWEFHHQVQNWAEIVAFHIAFVKYKFQKNFIAKLYKGISESEISFLEKLYDEQAPSPRKAINNTQIKFVKQDGSMEAYEVYNIFFREGIFFVYVPANSELYDIREFLSHRERVIHELLGRRMPSMVSFCVLVADLQDSVKISAELPPVDYFELINQLWKTLTGSFQEYQGIYGKHAGDGLLYYFIKKPGCNYIMDAVHCALELKKRMTQFSNEWKIRKGWMNDIYLNIGINEGREFFGSIYTASSIEYTALGDSINYASRLSDFARFGAIWTTKNVLNRLSSEELKDIHFGVRRKEHDREIFIKNTYARVMDLLDPADRRHSKFMDISTLPIAEIVDNV